MTNNFFERLKSSRIFDLVSYINEFSIKLNNPVSPREFHELKVKHGLIHIKTPTNFLNYFYPDSMIQLQKDNDVINAFIEYKVSSSFILAKIAYDFLK